MQLINTWSDRRGTVLLNPSLDIDLNDDGIKISLPFTQNVNIQNNIKNNICRVEQI